MASACSRPASSPPFEAAELHVEAIELAPQGTHLETWVRRQLEQGKGIRCVRPQGRGSSAAKLPRIDVTLAQRKAPKERALLAPQVPYVLRVKLIETNAMSLVTTGERTRRLEASEPLPRLPERQSDLQGVLEQAFDAAWARVVDKRALVEGGAGAWLAALAQVPSKEDAHDAPWQAVVAYERVGLAMDCLAARRYTHAVSPLLRIVSRASEDDAATIDQAVGRKAIVALGAIGDPSAVLPLIDAAQRQPVDHVVHSAYAVGAIGGRLATAWLVTLATGHDDVSVRQAAKEALGDRL